MGNSFDKIRPMLIKTVPVVGSTAWQQYLDCIVTVLKRPLTGAEKRIIVQASNLRHKARANNQRAVRSATARWKMGGAQSKRTQREPTNMAAFK